MPLLPPVNSTNSKLPVDFSLTLITSSDCSTGGEGGVDVAAATSHHQTATWTRLPRCLTRRWLGKTLPLFVNLGRQFTYIGPLRTIYFPELFPLRLETWLIWKFCKFHETLNL
ncbi:hypothetical protein M5689_003679 [Euphorbia peplus]|nr:hypothetical protein M5689_003679 [Euphorbia peplus]